MGIKKLLLIVLIGRLIGSGLSGGVAAQEADFEAFEEESLEAEVVKVLEEKEVEFEFGGETQLYQKLELLVTKGCLAGEKIIVESGNIPLANVRKYEEGDGLVVFYSRDFEGNDLFYIADYIRRGPLLALFLIFVVLVVAVARWRGATSLLGMGISFLVIFKFILPRILAGAEPVGVTVVGSVLMVPFTFFLSHGFNKKTVVAIGGTVVALVITGILAGFFVEATRLTGFASEEAGFLQVAKEGLVNIKGLLLAGIIIGVLGVLDDVTVSQSAIVFQLKKAKTKMGPGEVYKRAMEVGKDHIASMVNTLILVYTGAALPLLLLFIDNPQPFSEVINYEIVADEIVRTLVGSIGLIVAVPITTLIASWATRNE